MPLRRAYASRPPSCTSATATPRCATRGICRISTCSRPGSTPGLRGVAARALLERLRAWDRRSSTRVSHFIAISSYIARRIHSAYGREATVVYPPVRLPRRVRREAAGSTYVTVSALVPYKRIDVLLAAFRGLPDRSLVIVGDGPERARLQRDAPANVRFVGRLDDGDRDRELAAARAFVFAAEEDFGIAPLEAQGLGLPVIAFAQGGVAETIRGLDHARPTGVLFDRQTGDALATAIRTFETRSRDIDPEACRANALRFSPARFRDELQACIAGWQQDFLARPGQAGARTVSGPAPGTR